MYGALISADDNFHSLPVNCPATKTLSINEYEGLHKSVSKPYTSSKRSSKKKHTKDDAIELNLLYVDETAMAKISHRLTKRKIFLTRL